RAGCGVGGAKLDIELASRIGVAERNRRTDAQGRLAVAFAEPRVRRTPAVRLEAEIGNRRGGRQGDQRLHVAHYASDKGATSLGEPPWTSSLIHYGPSLAVDQAHMHMYAIADQVG